MNYELQSSTVLVKLVRLLGMWVGVLVIQKLLEEREDLAQQTLNSGLQSSTGLVKLVRLLGMWVEVLVIQEYFEKMKKKKNPSL